MASDTTIVVCTLMACVTILGIAMYYNDKENFYVVNNVTQTNAGEQNNPVKVWVDVEPNNPQCENKSLEELETTTITGYSMRPSLWPGQKVYYTKYNSSRGLSEGSIVIVKKPGEQNSVMHRLAYPYDGFFTTQGDNNLFPDPEQFNYESLYGIKCAVLDRGVRV